MTGGRPLGVRWGREGRAVPAVSDVKQLKPCSSTPPRAAAHPMTPDSCPHASPDSVTRRVCQRARRARLKLMWVGTSPWPGRTGQSKAPHFSTTPVPSTKISPTGSSGLAPVCTLHTLHTPNPSFPIPNILIPLLSDTILMILHGSPQPLESDFGFALILSLVSETPPPPALKSRLFGSFPSIFAAAATNR